jgi:hypothetical protein
MLEHGYECMLYYLLFYVSNMTDSISNRFVGPCRDWQKANKEQEYQITLSGSWNAAKKPSSTGFHKRSSIKVLTKHNVAYASLLWVVQHGIPVGQKEIMLRTAKEGKWRTMFHRREMDLWGGGGLSTERSKFPYGVAASLPHSGIYGIIMVMASLWCLSVVTNNCTHQC